MKRSAKTRVIGVLLSVGATAIVAGSPASADVNDLELTVPIAILDRSAAGTAIAPPGYGYENDSGLAAGLEGRLFWGRPDEYFHMGLMLGAQHQAGPLLGLAGGHAYRTTLIEAGLAARVLLPCLSRDSVKWRVGGVLALVGAHADAGEGIGAGENDPNLEARREAARALDHAGLGWRLGFDLSWNVGAFVVGIGLGARQYFAIDSPVARVWLMDLGLRIGGRFDLSAGPRVQDRFRYE